MVSNYKFLHDSDGILHFGKPTTCRYCGAASRQAEMSTPSGQPYVAHIPLDTCCDARAREVHAANKLWADRYRNLAQQTSGPGRAGYQFEERTLTARNQEIVNVMRAKQAVA